MGGGESLSEILLLELSRVHFVHASGLILDRLWQFEDSCVFQTAGLTQCFGEIDFDLVDNQAKSQGRIERHARDVQNQRRGQAFSNVSTILMTLVDEGMSNRECTTWLQRPLEADTILLSAWWSSRGSLVQKFERTVTKFAPHKALKSIA